MLPLVLSSGDPSGIGLEIICKAWQRRASHCLPPFFILADPEVVQARAVSLGLDVPLHKTNESDLAAHFDNALPVLPLNSRQSNTPGYPLTTNAAGTVEAIERAIHLVINGLAGAIVTCPIAKKNLYEAGFQYPGHTEFLAHLAQKITGKRTKPVMMFVGPDLKTVPITVHIALRHVPEALDIGFIIEVARITVSDLRKKFGIVKPRLFIAGLNPHAGEDGTMGQEENVIIRPAINLLRKKGIDIQGPFPADTLFHIRARKTYDAVLCMYHDQALIPIKTIGFDNTVNVTLGLPFIRTSPAHGTAFDIAQKGIASPKSLIAALRMSIDLMQRMRNLN
ncbi:MAG: 4-hydroxythreonine-4-phosphate dehydrogenase [Candidatus Tokpelaia sp. JSC085]|nr:MAG: 4-hydroxythreonine-4-phosphate dehydrogenase [Candidatus Tokpelaia sp. JSC085]